MKRGKKRLLLRPGNIIKSDDRHIPTENQSRFRDGTTCSHRQNVPRSHNGGRRLSRLQKRFGRKVGGKRVSLSTNADQFLVWNNPRPLQSRKIALPCFAVEKPATISTQKGDAMMAEAHENLHGMKSRLAVIHPSRGHVQVHFQVRNYNRGFLMLKLEYMLLQPDGFYKDQRAATLHE